MVVDLLEKSRVNIKDLTIPELNKGATAPLFDPKRKIGYREWISMTCGFNFQEESGWKQSMHQYFYLKYVDPERFSKLAIGEKQWRWTEKIKLKDEWWATTENEVPSESISRRLTYSKALFPDKRNKLALNANTEQMMFNCLEELRRQKKWDHFHRQAFYISIAFPNSVVKLGLDEESWQGIYGAYGDKVTESRNFPYRLVQAADMLCLMKMHYTQRFKEVKLDSSFLNEMRGLLAQCRQQNQWSHELSFTNIAFDLTILGAKEIRFTEQGMEIVGQSKPESVLSENAPDLPQRRRF